MKYDHAVVQAATARFFTSRHPIAWLTLPGCGPCAISPAHWRSKNLPFKGGRNLIAREASELTRMVRWLFEGSAEGLRPDLLRELRQIVCYCGRVRSVLALRQKDCVHESHFGQFERRPGLTSLAGWEFNLSERPSIDKPRIYRVLRTHSRLLARGRSVVLEGVTGLMEIRIVPSENLRLIVTGDPADDLLTAQVELHSALSERPVILPRFTREVVRRSYPTYSMLDHYLSKAYETPSRASAILRDEAAPILNDGKEPNYPALEIIEELLSSAVPAKAIPDDEIRQRIRLIKARLWDAPVIVGHVRNQLDLALGDSTTLSQLDRYPLGVQADIATLTMPLAKLETGDAYLSAA